MKTSVKSIGFCAVVLLGTLIAVPVVADDVDDFLRSATLGERLQSHRDLRALVGDYVRIEKKRARESDKLVNEWKELAYEININIREFLNALEKHDARVQELKAGLYCSVCKHSKSEIEKSGERFEAHVKRVHGKEKWTQASILREEEKKFDEYNRNQTKKRRELDHRQWKNEEIYDKLDKEVERDKDTLQRKIDVYVRSGNAGDLGALPEEQPRPQQSGPKRFELNEKQWWGEK